MVTANRWARATLPAILILCAQARAAPITSPGENKSAKNPWPDVRVERETGELHPGPGDPADLPIDSFRDVRGYDCNRMSGAEAVQLPPTGECPRAPVQIRRSENATFVVLQEANFVQVAARRCTGMSSRFPFYCGTYDHETALSEYITINHKDPMAASECRRIWEDRKVRLGNRDFDITPNTTFQQSWNAAGRHLYDYPGHIQCKGEAITNPTAQRVVDTRYTSITTSTEEMALAPDGRLTSVRRQVALPCDFHRKSCTVPSGTYVWDDLTEDQKCKLFKVRVTSGQVHTDAEGEETYVSTDGSALRFLIGAPTMRCNRMVLKTEHERIFLTRERDEPMFQRELAPQERSPLLYANVQDSYLETKLGSKLDQVISAVKQESCRTRSTHSLRYDQIAAVQRSAVDGETAYLGHGVFATASGEAWWRYKCKEIVARAMDLPKCHTALPVTLLNSDVVAHFAAAGKEVPTSYQFYLEPHSHRLLTAAATKECAPKLAPLFRTAHGRWISAGPRVALTEAPHRLNALHVLPDDDEIGNTDYAKGGLYTEEDVAEMDKFRMLPNVVHEVEVTMGQRAISRGWATSSELSELRARDVLLTHGHWYLDPFGYLWDRAEDIGDIGVTIWGICWFIKAITWALGLILRACYGPVDPRIGWCHKMCMVLIPSSKHFVIHRGEKLPGGWQPLTKRQRRRANRATNEANLQEEGQGEVMELQPYASSSARALPQPPQEDDAAARALSPPPGYRTRRPSHALLETPRRLRRAAASLWTARTRRHGKGTVPTPDSSSDSEQHSAHRTALDSALTEGRRPPPEPYANADAPVSSGQDTDTRRRRAVENLGRR